MATVTAYRIRCTTHENFLVHASSGGTTWTEERNRIMYWTEAKLAQAAVGKATWLDHKPVVEAVKIERGKCTCGEVTPENRLGHADGCRYFVDSKVAS